MQFDPSGPMPIWLLAMLVTATVALILLVRYAWTIGKAERAKAALAERASLDQEQWSAYQQYGEPKSN